MSIHVTHYELERWDNLPRGIIELTFCQLDITILPKLPDTLESLICLGNENLTELTELPKSLKKIHCFNNKLTRLPELPKTLHTLICNKNQLTSLPELPETLKILDCRDNQLTFLPKIPESIAVLIHYNNQFTSAYKTNLPKPKIKEQLNFLSSFNNKSR